MDIAAVPGPAVKQQPSSDCPFLHNGGTMTAMALLLMLVACDVDPRDSGSSDASPLLDSGASGDSGAVMDATFDAPHDAGAMDSSASDASMDASATDAAWASPADVDAGFGTFSADLIMEYMRGAGGEGVLATRTLVYQELDSRGVSQPSDDRAYPMRLEGMNDPGGRLDARVRLTIFQEAGIDVTWAVPGSSGPHVARLGSAPTLHGVYEGSLIAGELDLALTSGHFHIANASDENWYRAPRARLRATLVTNAAGDEVMAISGPSPTSSGYGTIRGVEPASDLARQSDIDLHGFWCNPDASALVAIVSPCGSFPGLQPTQDVDGDGLEQFHSECPELVGVEPVEPNLIQCCVDGDGTLALGQACLDGSRHMDGWLFDIHFHAWHATIPW